MSVLNHSSDLSESKASQSAPIATIEASAQLALHAPTAHGGPVCCARFKATPEDFRVFEQLNIDFSGEGEHLYLHVEKTDRNTADLIKGLSRCYGVPKKDIGTAGMKDKQAVTSQWLSVLTPLNEEPLTQWLASDDAPPFRLLDSVRHSRKLRTGAHTGNQFVIRLQDVESIGGDGLSDNQYGSDNRHNQESLAIAVQERIDQLAQLGFPNYYGPQRFGHQGRNVNAAVKWLCSHEKIPSMARAKRSLYLSAVRSAAFNRVLAARVLAGDWNQLRPGELCVLNGTSSVFTLGEEEFDATKARMDAFDIHPGAHLIGDGELLSTGDAKAFDEAELKRDPQYEILVNALMRLRVDASHRATRALCEDLRHQWINETTLEISVGLAPGVYATTLLAELFKEKIA